MMGELSPWHWAIVILVLVVLFGARRLPDAARSLGRSARILKSELRANDDAPPAATAPPPAPEAPSPADPQITTSQSDPRHH
jgi:sec-independent protein translocase protein TatA